MSMRVQVTRSLVTAVVAIGSMAIGSVLGLARPGLSQSFNQEEIPPWAMGVPISY